MKKCTVLLFLLSMSIHAQEWTSIAKPQQGHISRLHINKTNQNIIYAVGWNSKVYRTMDNGMTWRIVLTASNNSSVFAVAPSNQDMIYTQSWKSTDGGNTWQEITPVPLRSVYGGISRIAIHPTNPNIVFAGNTEQIMKTQDGGQTWVSVANLNVSHIVYNDLDNNILYGATWLGYSKFYKSINGGATWTQVNTFTPPNSGYLSKLEIYQNVLYAGWTNTGGSNYIEKLWKSTDGGLTWTELSLNPLNYGITQITDYKIVEGVIYAATDKGLYSSNDYGITWSKISSDWCYYTSVDANSTKIVLGSYANGVSMANKSDMIFKNVGVEPVSRGSVSIVETNNTNNAIAVIDGSAIYKYDTDGDYWQSIIPPSGESSPIGIASVFSKTSGKLFCAVHKDFYSSTDNGKNWTYIGKIPNYPGGEAAISADDQKIFFSGLSNGTIMYTSNGGISWGTVSIPGSTLYGIHYSNSNILYIHDNTGYHYSLNNGTTWQDLSGIPSNGTQTVVSRGIFHNQINDDKLYCVFAITGVGNVLFVKDAGTTNWVQRFQGVVMQTPLINGKIYSSKDGAKLYSAGMEWDSSGHGPYYWLYRSEDDGASWQRCSNRFNFYSNPYYTIVNDKMWYIEDNSIFEGDVKNFPTGTPPAITSSTLQDGIVDVSYNQQLAATGTQPIAWSVISGSLPSNLTLSTSGIISGIPTATGTFNFTVQATNSSGYDTKALVIEINGGVGIPEIKMLNIRIYPNPTTGELRIKSEELRIENIVFFDVFGRKLSVNKFSQQSEVMINISHFLPGTYFMKIQTEAGETLKKVVKK